MLMKRLYHDLPPNARTAQDDNPTLLVSWWCTGFSLAAILVRVCGRYVRTERLFMEDKLMLFSIAPLLIRMALVHVVMRFGTNNAITDGLSPLDIDHRSIGSRLVLASRIFYALFIWTAKYTVSEFLKRVVGSHWRRNYEIGLKALRYFLAFTFLIVFIATLAECQPIDHYWQVVPDPGPKCREGIAQLISMGVCDIITDVLLVIYPIPIVIASAMPLKRKISLTFLFTLSLGLVGLTAYRMPAVVHRRGSQQFRTLLASLEILAAAAVSNAIVIGSFIRDRGVKKAKYKFGSTGDSTLDRVQTRRTATNVTLHHWGSDADLVSDIGISLQPDLQSRTNSIPRPAPTAIPNSSGQRGSVNSNWAFPHDNVDDDSSFASDPKFELEDHESVSPGPKPGDHTHNAPGHHRVSFFDVGGLLDQTSADAASRRTSTRSHSTVNTHDFASSSSNPPSSSHSIAPLNPQPQQYSGRRSSRPILSDVGGLLSSHREESPDPAATLSVSPRDPASPSAVRGSRNSQRYPGVTTRFPPMSQPNHNAGEGDNTSLARSTSGGTTSSLIAALASNPPWYHAENSRHHGPPHRRGSAPQPSGGEELELRDAGGLLQ